MSTTTTITPTMQAAACFVTALPIPWIQMNGRSHRKIGDAIKEARHDAEQVLGRPLRAGETSTETAMVNLCMFIGGADPRGGRLADQVTSALSSVIVHLARDVQARA